MLVLGFGDVSTLFVLGWRGKPFCELNECIVRRFSSLMAVVGQRRGRSPSRVYSTPPGDWTKCAICLDVLSSPVGLPACGHSFCRECVATLLARPAHERKCPSCRDDVSHVAAAALRPNWSLRAALDALPVCCRHGVKQAGSEWVADATGSPAALSQDGAAAHEATCGFAYCACPFAGCGAQLRRRDVDAHDATHALAHARGERAARAVVEKRLTSSDARVATAEARVAALEAARQAAEVSSAAALARVAALEAAHAASTVQREALVARLAALEARVAMPPPPAVASKPAAAPMPVTPHPMNALSIPHLLRRVLGDAALLATVRAEAGQRPGGGRTVTASSAGHA